MEALKIINNEFHKCTSTYPLLSLSSVLCYFFSYYFDLLRYLLKQPSRKRLLLPTSLEPKNPLCYVCARSFLQVKINTNKASLGKLCVY